MKFQESKGLVSIIIPAYNLEQFIGKTLDSVINQNYRNIEIIVINDGSNDRTQAVIEEYEKKDLRIKGLHQLNGGAAKARNYGIKESQGEFITFLDGDDLLSNDAISANIGYLNNDLDLDWVSFPIIRVDQDNNPIKISGTFQNLYIPNMKYLLASEFIDAYKAKKFSGVCCGAIYRKKSIDSIWFPEGEYYEDSFFFSRLLANTTKCLLSPNGCYRYVYRTGSSQLQIKDAPRLRSELHCELERLRLFRERFPENETYYRQVENDLYYYFKTAFAKRIPGTESLYKEFLSKMTYKPRLYLSTEFKLAIYRIIGYKNITSMYNIIRRVGR